MDPEVLDLSKENIQPLRQGRLTSHLGVALQAESDPEAHLQLKKTKEDFEILIRSYEGDDPLEPWFRYILWVEQVYLKHGREGNLQLLLERCISHFKDNPKYQQDSRFVQLCLKFIEMSSAPLELYKQCHASGIGTECALFYVSWAFALECIGDMKRANKILEEGLKNNAWPLDQMRDAHRIFQLRVAKHVLSDSVDMRSEAEQEHREVLARIHHRMGNSRIAQGTAGVFQVHGQIRRTTNASVKPFNDENSEDNELASVGNYRGAAMPRKTVANKENIQQPAPWVPRQSSQRLQPCAPFAPRRVQNPDFQLHHDEEVAAPSTPSAFVSNVLKPRKLDEDNFPCPLAIFEPPDPTKRSMYCKDKVYAGGTEFSFEELRALAYLKGSRPKRKKPVMEDYENMHPQHRIEEHVVSKKDDSFQCPLTVSEPPDPTKIVQYCKNKVYQGDKEFSLEELRAELYLSGRQIPKSGKTVTEIHRDDFTCPVAVFESPNPKRRPMYRKSEVYADNTEYSLEELRARYPKYSVIRAAAVAEEKTMPVADRTLDESLTVCKLFGEELHKWKLFVSTGKENFVHNDSLFMDRYLRDTRQESVSRTPSGGSDTVDSSLLEAQIFGKDKLPSFAKLESPASIELPSFHPYMENTSEMPKQTLPKEPSLPEVDYVPQRLCAAPTSAFAVYADEDNVPETADQDVPFALYTDECDEHNACAVLPSNLPNNIFKKQEHTYKENMAVSVPHSSSKKQMSVFNPFGDDAHEMATDAEVARMQSISSIWRPEPGITSNQKVKARKGRQSTIFPQPPGCGVYLDEEECTPALNSGGKREQPMSDGISPHQITKQSPNHSCASFTTNTKEAQNLMQELWRDLEVKPIEDNLQHFERVGVHPVEEQVLDDKPMPAQPEFEIFKDKSDYSLKLAPVVDEIPLVPSPGMTPQEELHLQSLQMKENVRPEECPVPEPLPGPIVGTLQPSMRVQTEIIDAFDNEVTCNTAAFRFPLLSSTPAQKNTREIPTEEETGNMSPSASAATTNHTKGIPTAEETRSALPSSTPAANHTQEMHTVEEIKSANKLSLYPSCNLSIITEGSEGKSSSSSGSSFQPTMRHTTISSYTHATLAVVEEHRCLNTITPHRDLQEDEESESYAAVAHKLEYEDLTADMGKLKINQKHAVAEEVNDNGAVSELPEVPKENVSDIDPFDKTMITGLLKHMNFPTSRHKDRYMKLDTRMPVLKAKTSLAFGKDRYTVQCVLGEGSYAKVYKAVEAKTMKTVALKIQKPAWEWEMYICREIQLRLSDPVRALAFMDVNMLYVLNNGSIIMSDCALYGTLLSVINKFKIAKESVPEVLALYWLAELLAVGDALCKCQIIHSDIKPDNFVLRALPSLDHVVPTLQLIDMGRGIDMTLFPPNTCFNVVVSTHDFKCIEMQTNRPWTYQTDMFGIAATVHCILFGNYMKVYPKGNRWSNFGNMRRSSNRPLWERFFDTMLNIESCSRLPDLSIFREEVLEAMHTLVNGDRKVSSNFTKAVSLIESK